MVQRQLTYQEIDEYMRDTFDESISYGLNARQSISRTWVEFQRVMENTKIEEVMVFLTLCKLMLEHGITYPDISAQIRGYVDTNALSELGNTTTVHEFQKITEDLAQLYAKLI